MTPKAGRASKEVRGEGFQEPFSDSPRATDQRSIYSERHAPHWEAGSLLGILAWTVCAALAGLP